MYEYGMITIKQGFELKLLVKLHWKKIYKNRYQSQD